MRRELRLIDPKTNNIEIKQFETWEWKQEMPTHTHRCHTQRKEWCGAYLFRISCVKRKWHLRQDWGQGRATFLPNHILSCKYVRKYVVNGKSWVTFVEQRAAAGTAPNEYNIFENRRLSLVCASKTKLNVCRVVDAHSFAETSKSQRRKFDLLAFNGNCERTNIAYLHDELSANRIQ